MKTYLSIFSYGSFRCALNGAIRVLYPADNAAPIFLLFMVKCPVIAKDVRCKLGDVILLHKEGRYV